MASNSTYPKRGLCYVATSHSESDSSLFTRPSSPLTWYYNYSPWPGPGSALSAWPTDFAPMIHDVSSAASSVGTLLSILNGTAQIPISGVLNGANTIQNVLTFNEPDGTTSSGGTSSSPSSTAKSWLQYLAPLRREPYNLKLSLPATTGSQQGLTWLKQFNTSCFSLNKTHGCEFDFVATHWYGDFVGLQSWLSGIHALYPAYPVWLTEFDVPSVSVNETGVFLNQSLPYLDSLSYVERYAWFGAFRENDANGFTGDAVSLLDKKGGLTGVGGTWMGGAADGFEVGTSASGSENGAGAVRIELWLAMVAFGMMVMREMWCI